MHSPSHKKCPVTSAAITGFAIAALSALIILFRLDTVPGLSADEAWVGLRAMEYQKSGFISFHGMNWYTGAFHVWLTSKIFDISGPGLLQLRAAGVIFNVLAAGLLGFFIARVYGILSAATLAAVLVALPFYPLESRIAWEVCALQNILAAAIIISAYYMATLEEIPLCAAIVFCIASALGTLNHIIFVALPLSFAAGFFIWQEHRADKRFSNLVFASACNIAALCVLVIAKKELTDAFWLAHRAAVSLFFAAVPLCAAFAAWRYGKRGALLCSSVSEKAGNNPQLKKFLFYLAGAGLAACLWFHATAFLGIISGFNVFKRMYSLDLGIVGATLLFLFAAIVAGEILAAIFNELKDSQDINRLFIALCSVALCATFPLLRNTNSMRYYIVPYVVFACAAAVFIPGRLRGQKQTYVLLCTTALLLINCVELLAPQVRKPLQFREGWHGETSARMMNIAWLAKKMENEKTCRFSGDPFISRPLEFMYRAKPWPCDAAKEFSGQYCYTCQEPPYIK
jgi:hypothetical protein